MLSPYHLGKLANAPAALAKADRLCSEYEKTAAKLAKAQDAATAAEAEHRRLVDECADLEIRGDAVPAHLTKARARAAEKVKGANETLAQAEAAHSSVHSALSAVAATIDRHCGAEGSLLANNHGMANGFADADPVEVPAGATLALVRERWNSTRDALSRLENAPKDDGSPDTMAAHTLREAIAAKAGELPKVSESGEVTWPETADAWAMLCALSPKQVFETLQAGLPRRGVSDDYRRIRRDALRAQLLELARVEEVLCEREGAHRAGAQDGLAVLNMRETHDRAFMSRAAPQPHGGGGREW